MQEISDSIGADVTAALFNILREIEEFKVAMTDIQTKTHGKRSADMNTVRYCGRYDIFIERMSSWLTEDFTDTLKAFTELI